MLDGVLTETEGGGWWCQEWHRYVTCNSDVCHNDDKWDENTTKKNYDDDIEDDYDDDGYYHDDDDDDDDNDGDYDYNDYKLYWRAN